MRKFRCTWSEVKAGSEIPDLSDESEVHDFESDHFGNVTLEAVWDELAKLVKLPEDVPRSHLILTVWEVS